MKVVSVPELGPPLIVEEPVYNPSAPPVPHVITMGPSDVEEGQDPGFRWYVEVCEAYEDAASATEDDDLENAEQVQARYGISQEDACGFAVFGLSTHEQLNHELELARWAEYTTKLREQLRSYRQQLINRYEIVRDLRDSIVDQLDDSKE